MNSPHGNYSPEQALELARQCKYGPLAKPTDPTPSIEKAIEIIRNDPTIKACTWLTGQVAIEVLEMSKG